MQIQHESCFYSGMEYVASITRTLRLILSGTGFFLNMLVIAAVMKRKCKTSIQLVLSLATSDMLLAGFHCLFPFITFTTQWTNNEHVLLSMSSNTSTNFSQLMIGILRAPRAFLTSADNEHIPDNQPSSSLEDLMFDSNSTKILQELIDAGFVPKETPLNSAILNHGMSKNQTVLQQIMSAYYLMPNVACILSMMGITTCLFITVARPLQQHLLLSKKRGNIIVGIIWLISFSVSFGVYIYIIIYESGIISVVHGGIVLDVIYVLWYVILFVFFVISCMYIVIVYLITCKRMSKASSQLKENKAMYVRATVTAVAITSTYALCYLPFIWNSVLTDIMHSSPLIEQCYWNEVMQGLFLLNTNLNAIIYAFRLPEVSTGLRDRFRILFCK
mgnify:FL=1